METKQIVRLEKKRRKMEMQVEKCENIASNEQNGEHSQEKIHSDLPHFDEKYVTAFCTLNEAEEAKNLHLKNKLKYILWVPGRVQASYG